MEAGHEMEVASLQDPALVGRNMLNASNTIGNQGLYATMDILGYRTDASAPSLRRFPFLTHDGPQEYRILSIHASHGHQICRPSLAPKAEPQRINDQEQISSRNGDIPRLLIDSRQDAGMAVADG